MNQYNYNGEEMKSVQICICDKSVTTELSGDFTLPDYQPEIRRLLKVGACVQPPSKYISMTDAEFTGNIDYYVLYCGSDGEVYCAPVSADYSVRVPFDTDNYADVSNGTSACAFIVPDTVSGRVIAPRKLNIKCRMKTHAYVYGEALMNGQTNMDFDPSYTERLICRTKAARVMRAVSPTFEVNDEIIPDPGAGEIRVICAEGRVLMGEAGAGSGEVNCRGDVYLKLLLNRENGANPHCIIRKMPFARSVVTEGCDINCNAYAKGTVSELSVTVDEGRISVVCGIVIEATAQKNEETEYVKDTYSTLCETACEYKKMNIANAGAAFNSNFTLGDSMTLEDAGIDPAGGVADTSGCAYIDECRFEGGKCIIQGHAKFNLQIEKDGEYSSSEIEFPFKFETDAPDGMTNCESYAEVVSCRSRIDGERVGVDAEISICGRMWGESEVYALAGIKFGEGIKPRRGEYIICYPSPEDTLWSIAKKYASPASKIAGDNGICRELPYDSKESLSGVHYLII